ncbi:chlorophyll synthesis pathway protein BchC [Venturia nashicola]|uniref:Chlorophyll synthesis pathway protein BchC n=1 Tax=Venturia nashicola TaxID=86259 RepID=A0A4Z1NYN4_9PEZI|nr:chlorophyll synthesis pathway protein BchC [Venturia nashicola]
MSSAVHIDDVVAGEKKNNKSFVLEKQGVFGFQDRPFPSLRSSRDVLVRIEATGICGSDVHYWQHGRIGNYVVENPIVLGHESAGVVELCGPDVKGLAVGDRIALEPGVGCTTCNFCRSGKYNLCSSMRFAATPPFDGTLSTFYSLPEECCFKLPDHVPLEEGALLEPLAVAVHVCRLADIRPGSSLVVFGAGPIGLLCCAVARAFGASSITCVDIVDSRLEFAKNYAASKTYRMKGDELDLTQESIQSRLGLVGGPDVVIEATGAAPCIDCGVQALRRGGTFVQAGLGKPKVDFPLGQICDKEISLKGSFRYGPGDYALALELLASGKVSVKELITHRFDFEDAERAFTIVRDRQGIKTIIRGPGVLDTPAETKAVDGARL